MLNSVIYHPSLFTLYLIKAPLPHADAIMLL